MTQTPSESESESILRAAATIASHLTSFSAALKASCIFTIFPAVAVGPNGLVKCIPGRGLQLASNLPLWLLVTLKGVSIYASMTRKGQLYTQDPDAYVFEHSSGLFEPL